jgi:hypothetical protein
MWSLTSILLYGGLLESHIIRVTRLERVLFGVQWNLKDVLRDTSHRLLLHEVILAPSDTPVGNVTLPLTTR